MCCKSPTHKWFLIPMTHRRLLLRKIPSFTFRAKHLHVQPVARVHTQSAEMTFNQRDVLQQTVDIPRGDLSRQHYTNIRKPKVVIVGCSYAGMSATLTLAALKDGLPIPFASYGDYSHLRDAPSVQDFDITIVDERDGFCKFYKFQADTQMQGNLAYSCIIRTSSQCWCSISPYLTCENTYDVEALQRIFRVETTRYRLYSGNCHKRKLGESNDDISRFRRQFANPGLRLHYYIFWCSAPMACGAKVQENECVPHGCFNIHTKDCWSSKARRGGRRRWYVIPNNMNTLIWIFWSRLSRIQDRYYSWVKRLTRYLCVQKAP
jgi:hypothetical protein